MDSEVKVEEEEEEIKGINDDDDKDEDENNNNNNMDDSTATTTTITITTNINTNELHEHAESQMENKLKQPIEQSQLTTPPQTEILSQEEDSSTESVLNRISQMQYESPVFITYPKLQEGINSYLIYLVYGKNIPKPLPRKYSDFNYLRDKLSERFPGVYIPNIPERPSDSTTDKDIIEMNIKLLNSFCSKLFAIPFISNSTEMQLFFSNIEEDVIIEMERMPQLSFKDIIDRYKIAIPLKGGMHSFDIAKAKEQLEEQCLFSKELLSNIKNLKDFARETMENKTKEISNYVCLLNVFQDYEKYALIEYADYDDTKLVFSNKQNKDLKIKYDIVISSLRNPYIAFNVWIEEDECDLKSMAEVYDSIKHFESEYRRLNNRVKEIESDIIKYNTGEGKSGLASLLSFQSIGDTISELENEKEENQIGMYYLDIIIAMVSEYSIQNFTSFKLSKLSDYYKHLKQFNDIQMMNNKCIIDLWQCVQEDNKVKV